MSAKKSEEEKIKKPALLKDEKKIPKGILKIDAFENGLKELFFIRNPHLKKEMPEAKEPLEKFLKNSGIKPVWAYYPWRNLAIKILPENLYFELRTARNKNIISSEEQKNYRQLKVGVAGLSVGSAIVHAITLSGGPKTLKIADFDTLEVSNLNRIKAKLTDFGQNKTHIAAHEVWELDPFADVHVWDKGITKDTLEKFILGKPGLDVFIDEMDSLDLKIAARIICRKNKIPVLMATDNGDGIILDVERFELEPKRKIFHGLIGNIEKEGLANMDFRKWLQLATKIVGPEYLTEKMQDSIANIGRAIAAVPQLGTSAAMAGSAMNYVLRRIANSQKMPSGRYIVSLEEKLEPGFSTASSIKKRMAKTREFISKFNRK